MDNRPRRGLSRTALPSLRARGAAPGRKHKPDYWMVILSALLLTIGLVVVYSFSPAWRQVSTLVKTTLLQNSLLLWGLALLHLQAAAQIPLDSWRKFAKPLAIVTIVGCLIVMITPLNLEYPQTPLD